VEDEADVRYWRHHRSFERDTNRRNTFRLPLLFEVNDRDHGQCTHSDMTLSVEVPKDVNTHRSAWLHSEGDATWRGVG
jgi:hypothetical protein